MDGQTSSAKRVCLIVMPFTPIVMPGLGVSTLKSTLTQAGIATDVFYAALEFFRFFTGDINPYDAIFDYEFIAVNYDLGNVFFAETLWGGDGAEVRKEIQGLAGITNPSIPVEDIARGIDRITGYVERTRDYIEHCYRARDWSQYDVVGFSSTFSQNIGCLSLARLLRERHPELVIVFGGANCEGEMGMEMLRSFPQVDAVIQGEADLAFPAFIHKLRNGLSVTDVPGIVYREGGRVGEVREGPEAIPLSAMDSLPVPDFDDYFEQLPSQVQALRASGQLSLPIETSRGCWWGAIQHCVFCGLNSNSMAFRSKSPARALAEIRGLRDRYQVKQFYAVDNIISKRYFKEVLPELEGEGLNIFYETKSNLTEDEVNQFARSGIRKIQPGIEGLSSEILELMKKGVKGYLNVELLKWCAMSGVKPVWFYLYGFPNEPHEPYFRDIDLMDRLVHLPPPRSPNPVLMDRFSPIFTRREAYGYTSVRTLPRSKIYYRGLTEEARFNISYHFAADLPQGNALPYQQRLWDEVRAWQARYADGARFHQFQGTRTTLLVDTRRDERRAYILTGVGHWLYDHLRCAHTRERMIEFFEARPSADAEQVFSFDDLYIVAVAGELKAETISSPGTAAEVDGWLASLVERWIVLSMDDRYLGLALDCTDDQEAAAYGLPAAARRVAAPPNAEQRENRKLPILPNQEVAR
jgi:ribosomal peptide maturation radical SAM protein 1